MYKLAKLFSRSLPIYPRSPPLLCRTPINSPRWMSQQPSTNTMKVTILGAGGKVAQGVALMLKQSPYIDELCLFENKKLDGFAADLNYIDTKCRVIAYSGPNEIPQALSRSNLVVIFACCQHNDSSTYSSLFDRNAPIVKEHAMHIAKYSPKSVVALGSEPINNMVPMFSEIMKKHGNYNPNAIFGITTIDVVRANKFVAEVLGLDPECVLVPMVGGHSEQTIVPVLSKATPCNELTNAEIEDITINIRQAEENLLRIRNDGAHLSYAFSTARFVISLVKALRGQADIVECAYVRAHNIRPPLSYMVTPLLLGPGGIAKNLGVPELSDYEECLLENAIPILMEDTKKGEFAGGRPMQIVDGVLQDGPLCDVCNPNPKAPRCPPDHCDVQSLFAKTH